MNTYTFVGALVIAGIYLLLRFLEMRFVLKENKPLKIKPFKCPECDKRFYARHMMKKHLQNHTRPYTCPVCNKGFIRRYLMKHHFKKKHEEG